MTMFIVEFALSTLISHKRNTKVSTRCLLHFCFLSAEQIVKKLQFLQTLSHAYKSKIPRFTTGKTFT